MYQPISKVRMVNCYTPTCVNPINQLVGIKGGWFYSILPLYSLSDIFQLFFNLFFVFDLDRKIISIHLDIGKFGLQAVEGIRV